MREKFLLWSNPRQAIMALVLVLVAIGIGNDFSASYVRAEVMTGSQYYFFKRYLIFTCLGFGILWFFGYHFDYHRLLSPRFMKIVAALTLLSLVAVRVAGHVVNGSRRWISIGGISLQPSELAKVSIILIATAFLGEYLRRQRPVSLLQWPQAGPLVFTVIASFFVLKQPDMGTAAIMLGIGIYMYILAGIPRWQIFSIIGLGAVGAAAIAVLEPYRLNRIRIWKDPWLDPLGAGYQMVQSQMAIGSGGLLGVHWGQGSSKFFYLPEAHTDFAFAVYCQEWGFLGALLLLLLFALLALAFYRIAIATKDKKGFLLVCGCSCLLIGQSVANIAMVTGILPVIGVPLMFISYGGTSLMVNFLCLGLILSVYRMEAAREIRELREQAGLPPEEIDGLRVVSRRPRP
ncbi:MAG: Cell division protein FtsW [Succiniclasticum sp.]|jgi:cell division protein FtsW